jgi:hypothetical protein
MQYGPDPCSRISSHVAARTDSRSSNHLRDRGVGTTVVSLPKALSLRRLYTWACRFDGGFTSSRLDWRHLIDPRKVAVDFIYLLLLLALFGSAFVLIAAFDRLMKATLEARK